MFPWNEGIWEALRDRIDRLPHAVLFQGSEGVGKVALAERLAAGLLCEAPGGTGDACGQCAGCRWVAAGSHPDLRRVEPDALSKNEAPPDEPTREATAGRRSKPSNEIRIDQIRALSDFLYVNSHRGKRRVAIVHPAEAMNVNAANALLKGLEEPPAGAVFLLVAHHPARLLPTIRSRCVVVSVPRPEHAAALAWLESVTAAKDARRWLAFAGGAPRLAYEYSCGERSAHLTPYLEALAQGATQLEAVDRESLEALAEVLQKHAIDRVTAALAGRTLYGTGGPGPRGSASALAWVTFARYMSRATTLARHPVNPRLFSAEMISEMRKLT